MLVRVKSGSAKEVFSNLKKYDEKTREKLGKAVNRSLNAIRRGAKTRIHSVSGLLSRRIKKTYDSNVLSGTVRSTAPHAHLIEFGTRAIGETGSKAKPLSKNPVQAKGKAMVIPGIGFRKSYKHKGMKARPYMRPSFESERPKYIRNIEKAVKP